MTPGQSEVHPRAPKLCVYGRRVVQGQRQGAGPRFFGTHADECRRPDDFMKALIERDGKYVRTKASLETARHMKLVGEQHGAGIRRPPENGLIVVVPGENALSIGFEEPLWTKVSPYREEAVRGCSINRRETKIVRFQAEHRHVRYAKRSQKTMPGER